MSTGMQVLLFTGGVALLVFIVATREKLYELGKRILGGKSK